MLHSNTKEHAFSQSVFCLFFGGISRYIDILTEKFREVLCSILSEKNLFWNVWPNVSLVARVAFTLLLCIGDPSVFQRNIFDWHISTEACVNKWKSRLQNLNCLSDC